MACKHQRYKVPPQTFTEVTYISDKII